MATDAQTLTNAAATAKYSGLSEREILLCLAGQYGATAGITSQQAVNLAATNDYSGLSDRTLYECLLALIS